MGLRLLPGMVGLLSLAPLVAIAAEAAIEACLEPMSVLHLRSEGLPLRDEQILCYAQGQLALFPALDFDPGQGVPKATYTLTVEGAAVTVARPGQAPVTVLLAPNQAEQIAGEFPTGSPLRVRFEQKPWPADPFQRWLSVTAIDVPFRSLVERAARTVDLRIEGIEHLCAEPVTFHFSLGVSLGDLLAIATESCGARWDRSQADVIRLDPASDLPRREPPAPPEDELLADVEAALARAASAGA